MARRRARVSTSVLVCRGCCCGSEAKHPDVDHDGHVERLRAATDGVNGRVMTVDCLGPCERSNVVVVRRGTRRTWFGDLLDDEQIDRLGAWIGSDAADPPADLAAHRFDGPTPRARRRLLPERGDDLAGWCVDVLAAGGVWTMGVVGALAEFDTGAGVDADVRPATPAGEGHVVEARSSTGAMRVVLDSTTRTFAFGQLDAPEKLASRLLVRTSAGLPATDGLIEVGRDGGALFEHESDQTLFDLGLGRRAAHFMIRTDDHDLIGMLRRHLGTPLADIETDVFTAMVESSPTRVVRTALGRIEVTAPIPPPDGESPIGSHTHLRPPDLGLGLDLPHELEVPAGWHLGPIHYPPSDRSAP
ncbi:MAG: hypothetical protein AAGD33_12600 [Actinomycetota bacterium]